MFSLSWKMLSLCLRAWYLSPKLNKWNVLRREHSRTSCMFSQLSVDNSHFPWIIKEKRSLNFELKSCLWHWLTSPFKPICHVSTSEQQPAAFPSLNTFKNKWVNMKLISWKIGAPRLGTHTRAMHRLWEKWFDHICMWEKIAQHILSTRCNWFLILMLLSTTSLIRWYCFASSWLENCLFLLIVMPQLAADVFILAEHRGQNVFIFFLMKRSWGKCCCATGDRGNLFLIQHIRTFSTYIYTGMKHAHFLKYCP